MKNYNKVCKSCEESKDVTCFSPLKTTKDGRHSYCKPCRSARNSESYHKKKDLTRLKNLGILPLMAFILSPVILLTLLVLDSALLAEKKPVDLHLSPLSFTFHPRADAPAKRSFPNNINGGGTTYHAGVHAKVDYGYSSTALWVFEDSFGRIAGGAMQGFNYRFFDYFSIGAMGGFYVRQKIPRNVRDFPVSVNIKNVEILPVGGVTGGATLPITKKVGLSTNCVVTILVNNCSMGLRLRF